MDHTAGRHLEMDHTAGRQLEMDHSAGRHLEMDHTAGRHLETDHSDGHNRHCYWKQVSTPKCVCLIQALEMGHATAGDIDHTA
nr:hypothetical protein BaRGS_025877 [Batillaria attramentaria]